MEKESVVAVYTKVGIFVGKADLDQLGRPCVLNECVKIIDTLIPLPQGLSTVTAGIYLGKMSELNGSEVVIELETKSPYYIEWANQSTGIQKVENKVVDMSGRRIN